MNKSYKDKATRLGKYMNGNSKFAVPIVKCILECFEIVFSEHELDLLLLMENGSYNEQQLRELWNDETSFDETFAKMKAKGAIWQRRQKDYFELTPIFPGWIEIYSSGPESGADGDNRKRLLAKFGEFEKLLKTINIPPVRAYMNRINTNNMAHESGRMSTVVARGSKRFQINEKFSCEQTVVTSGEIYTLLEKHSEQLSVMNCFCRMKKQMEGHQCDFNLPVEGCLVVGRMSQQLEEAGMSRHLSFEEAVSMIKDFEDKGCIHTTYHYGIISDEEEVIICNCCIDCCFLYNSFREGALSQLLIKAYYKPEINDKGRCIGCNKCSRYCPTGATYYDKESHKLVFQEDKCIGCGQCVTQCPTDARIMMPCERNVFVKTRKRKEWQKDERRG